MIIEVCPDQFPTIATMTGREVASGAIQNLHGIVYNAFDPALADPRVRRALFCAIDRQANAQGLLAALPPLDGTRRRLSPIDGTVPDLGSHAGGLCLRAALLPGRRVLRPGAAALRRSASAAAGRLHPAHGRAQRARAGLGMTEPLLALRHVGRRYGSRRGLLGRPTGVQALDGVSLTVARGRTLGLVGESGSGKSMTGRLALGRVPPDAGSVLFEGVPLPQAATPDWRRLRACMQMNYQDPLGALDRRLPILEQVREPLDVHGIDAPKARGERALGLLRAVGLRPDRGNAIRTSCPAASASTR